MTRLPRPQANILPGGDLTPSGSLSVDSLGAVGGVALPCLPPLNSAASVPSPSRQSPLASASPSTPALSFLAHLSLSSTTHHFNHLLLQPSLVTKIIHRVYRSHPVPALDKHILRLLFSSDNEHHTNRQTYLRRTSIKISLPFRSATAQVLSIDHCLSFDQSGVLLFSNL